METEHISKKNNHLFGIIACVWLIFSCISIIRAFNEWKLYDTLSGNTPINTQSILGQKITRIKNTLQANQSMQKQEYEEALQLISWTSSEDYYNRGTIQTLLAYKNALQSSISWLQNAQVFVAQAQQNFNIAKKLSTSKTITDAIVDNENTINSLSAVVDIKTCYGMWQAIISHINDITTTIKNIKDTLDQEEAYITKRASSLDATCYDKLQYIVDTSKEQVGLIQLQMEKNMLQIHFFQPIFRQLQRLNPKSFLISRSYIKQNMVHLQYLFVMINGFQKQLAWLGFLEQKWYFTQRPSEQ